MLFCYNPPIGRSGKKQRNIFQTRARKNLDPEIADYLDKVVDLREALIRGTDPDAEAKMTRLAGNERSRGIIIDIARQERRWGNLSPKQIELVRKIQARAKKEAWEKARLPDPAPVPGSGRIDLRVEVLSLKEKTNRYGRRWTMLVVEDRGFRLFGSLPKEFLKNGQPTIRPGEQIVFRANVSPSDRDPCFGFFDKPELFH